MSEYAPGLPEKATTHPIRTVKSPEQWEFVVQAHDAKKAGCFTKDTHVTLADGSLKCIIDIIPGDMVRTPRGPKRVLNLWDNGLDNQWVSVVYNNKQTVVTPNHPFFVEGLGWVPIAYLIGKKVTLSDGVIFVNKKEMSCLRKVMYSQKPTQCMLFAQLCRTLISLGKWSETVYAYSKRSSIKNDIRTALSKSFEQVASTGKQILARRPLCNTKPTNGGCRKTGRLFAYVNTFRPTKAWNTQKEQRKQQEYCCEEEAGRGCLELERWGLQWRSVGHIWCQLFKSAFSKKAYTRAWLCLREVWQDHRKVGSTSYNSFPTSIKQLVRHGTSTMHQASCTARKDIQGFSKEFLCISWLPRINRSRYDLEIEDSHCYYANGYLVHNSHFDIRLGDPQTGHAHSFVTRKGLPELGKVHEVVRTETHTIPYFEFEGQIPSGYGAGTVKKHIRDKIEVLSSRPEAVLFNRYHGKETDTYALFQAKDRKATRYTPEGITWLLSNVSPMRSKRPHLEPHKGTKYKTVTTLPVDDDTKIHQPKISGAHMYVETGRKAGEPIRVFSYKESEVHPDKLIEHTWKLPTMSTPKGMENSTGRAEAYFVDKEGKAVDEERVAGILNSGVLRAREYIVKNLLKPRLMLFNMDRIKGKSVRSTPYGDKIEHMKKLENDVIHMPEIARTADEKLKMKQTILDKKHPLTVEGIVEWDLKNPNIQPKRMKPRKDYDVYIRKIFEGKKQYAGKGAGGFEYSWTEDGPISGRVGTGFKQDLRFDMFKNPDKYLGRVAKVTAQRYFTKTKTLGGSPAFIGFHAEKGKQPGLEKDAFALGFEKIALDAVYGGDTRLKQLSFLARKKRRDMIMDKNHEDQYALGWMRSDDLPQVKPDI